MSSKAILAAIKRNKTFLITTHVNPDIDALASELVMALYLKSQGKKVYVINAGKVASMYLFLPYVRLIKKFSGQKIDYDAAVILDCGDLDRIDTVKKTIDQRKIIINIDHHITNDDFGDFNLVKSRASSTSEILYDFLKEAKFKLTKETAVLLYTGIMTDTGSFRYDNTAAHTHAIVSELLKFRFSVDRLYKQIYETIPLADLKKFAKLISSFEMSHKGKVASIELSQSTVSRFSGNFDLRDKIFSFLRGIKGIEVIAIFTEGGKKLTRINFRSQEKVDVAKLASLFNGGGHKKASGCRFRGSLKSAKQKIFSQLKKIVK